MKVNESFKSWNKNKSELSDAHDGQCTTVAVLYRSSLLYCGTVRTFTGTLAILGQSPFAARPDQFFSDISGHLNFVSVEFSGVAGLSAQQKQGGHKS